MKHPSLVYLVICLWCWAPLAQLRAIPLSVFLGGSPPSASAYLVNESFEGTGYANGAWTESGTVDPDYSTSGLSLDGSECLAFTANTSSAYKTFTATSSCWMYFKVRFEALPSTAVTLGSIRNSSDTNLIALRLTETGKVRVLTATTGPDSVKTVAINTTYQCALYFISNGTGAAWLWETGSKVNANDSSTFYMTRATTTSDAARIAVYRQSNTGGNVYYDTVQASLTELP